MKYASCVLAAGLPVIQQHVLLAVRAFECAYQVLQNGRVLQIAEASIEDAEQILELQRLAYQSEASLYQDWTIPPLTQTLTSLRAEFSQKTILKAERDGALVGSVRASAQQTTVSIGRLIVHPGCQRAGIGTQLMTEIEQRFPEAASFELFTGSRSAGNLRLYERLGYTIFRTEPLSSTVTLVFLKKQRVPLS